MPEANNKAKWLKCLELFEQNQVTERSEWPKWLVKKARGALRKARGGQAVDNGEVEDLVNEFLFKLWSHAKKSGGFARLQAEWTGWSDKHVEGVCKKMLFHVAVEASDSWDDVRAMRRAVRLSLERGLPAADGAMPQTLQASGRLSLTFVAKALAEIVAEDWEVRRDAKVLATRLMTSYPAPGSVQVHSEEGDILENIAAEVEHDVEAISTAKAVAKTFKMTAGESGVRVLRLRDGGLKDIAAYFGIALATAHQKSLEAIAAFRKVARAHDASYEEQVLALDLLGARSLRLRGEA